jgi:hypothetical protein
VVGHIDDRRKKKVQKLEYCETQPAKLLEYLSPCFKEFVLRNYVSRWQDLQFRECLKNIPFDTMLSYVDFSNNYMMKT